MRHLHPRSAGWHHHHEFRRSIAEATSVVARDVVSSLHRRKSDCKDDPDSPECEKPAGARNNTLPIVLGSLIPIVCAMVVLVWLHRRHMNKVKQEDAMDKTKSMDFGMGNTVPLGPGEKSQGRSGRQMSMDIHVVSPYLLPGVVNGSQTSLARSAHSIEDRYGRPTTAGSQSHGHHQGDGYGRSIRFDDSPDGSKTSMDAELLGGAQLMPTSTPPPRSVSLGNIGSPPREPQPPVPRINVPTSRSPPAIGLPSSPRDRVQPQQKSLDAAEQPLRDRDSVGAMPGTANGGPNYPRDSVPVLNHPEDRYSRDSEKYEDYLGDNQRPLSDNLAPHDNDIAFRFSVASPEPEIIAPQPISAAGRKSLAPGAFDNRRLSMGFRPLPPEGKPDDTAEERALRIRSFYKEYFSVDEGPPPPLPQGGLAYGQAYGEEYYGDDYSQEHSGVGYEDTAIFDPDSGGFILPGAKPFAESPVRRAMTPPPRMPPRFDAHGMGPGPRAGSAAAGRFRPPPGPRSYSSASNAHGGRPPANKRPIEPPTPLSILPTPSKVGEDAFAMPIIFAPDVRNRRDPDMESSRGRLGGLRPYSPAVPSHNPLVSSFDDLAMLPSPHMMRKSSTFTALDFAPPKKFKNEGDMSDAGSIRSNRSGLSSLHAQNVRNGAYRVSRIPTQVVPLKSAIADELKPTWDMRSGAK